MGTQPAAQKAPTTRVDFAFGADHRLRAACQVVHRHYLAGHRLVVHAGDAQRLAWFERLLWSFDSAAFVPHARPGDAMAAHARVVLTHDDPVHAVSPDDAAPAWLLNLGHDCPPGAADFRRILEIVSHHEQDRLAARARWRDYEARGFELHAHALGDSDKRASGR